MFEIKMKEEEIKELFLKEIQKKLEVIERQTMLMDSKQLCKMLSLSWPTVEKIFIRDPKFPSIRIGSKWLFNRKEVQDYIDSWSIRIKDKNV